MIGQETKFTSENGKTTISIDFDERCEFIEISQRDMDGKYQRIKITPCNMILEEMEMLCEALATAKNVIFAVEETEEWEDE